MFSTNDAFAASISFDDTRYFSDHSFIISVTDNNVPAGTKVRVTDSSGFSCDYPLMQVGTVYQTPPVNFSATTSACTNVMFKIPSIPPPLDYSITASYPIGSSSPVTASATVIDSNFGSMPPAAPATITSSPTQIMWGNQITSCSQYGNDLDNDGICDNWETPNGLKIPYLAPDANGAVPNGYYTLSCNPSATYDPTKPTAQNPTPTSPTTPFYDPLGDLVCPGSDKPDIYVQVDWMLAHNPNWNALADVVQAFWNKGIRLHIQQGNPLPFHREIISGPTLGAFGTTDFDSIKNTYFGTSNEWLNGNSNWPWQENLTSKKQVFHYALFDHSQQANTASSGIAEMPGNDVIVSLGQFTANRGSYDQQEGSFMHELGHNLGLDHGGPGLPTNDDWTNCKPNYLSVMSYSREFNESYPISRPLDYSKNQMSDLNEGSLNERLGIGQSIPSNLATVYGVPTGELFKIGTAADTSHLVLWLSSDRNTNDASGNSNNANVINAPTDTTTEWTRGKIGNAAFHFNGADYLRLANPSQFSFDTNQPFSISAWVRTSDTTHSMFIASNANGLGSGAGYIIWKYSGYPATLFRITDNQNNVFEIAGKTPINDGSWQHIVVTYDGRGNEQGMKIYINGTLDGSGTNIPITNSIASTNPLAIGAINWGGYTFNGDMDDVQVLSTQVTSTYINSLLGGQPSDYQKLWLGFDGRTTSDASGNSNNAQIKNAPTDTTTEWTSGKNIGDQTAFHFNGVDFLQIPYTSQFSFDTNQPFSVSAWVRTSDTTHNMFIAGNDGFASSNSGFEIWKYSGYPATLFRITDNQNNVFEIAGKTPINDGSWHHIVATYDGSGNEQGMKVYLDGTLDGSGTNIPITNSIISTQPLAIGAFTVWGYYGFNGDIDDVQVLNYAVDSPYINSLLGGQQSYLDANGNGVIESSVTNTDINKLGAVACDGTDTISNTLRGYDDWDHLIINSNLQQIATWKGGVSAFVTFTPQNESSYEQYYPHLQQPKISFADFSNSTQINLKPILNATSDDFNKTFTIAFNYQKPKDAAVDTWLKHWGWHIQANKPYKLPSEITMDMVRDIRSSHIHSLNYTIQNLPDNSFNYSAVDRTVLNNDLSAVDGFIQKDDLYDATQKLIETKKDLETRIIDPASYGLVLYKANNNLQSLDVASKVSPTSNIHNHTPTIELDKKTYSWTDRVYITITAPDHNLDPNLIDTIGDSPGNNVTISTRGYSLHNYKLVETGVDTGIFTGYVILTGDHNIKGAGGVDGAGLEPTGSGPSGTGPTNGFLPSEDQDGISVSYQFANNQTVTASSLIRWNIGEIKWLESSYPSSGQGVMQIADPDMNLDPKAVDKFDTNVWSDSDSGGIKITMTETGQDTGIFQGTVYFTTNLSSSGNRLHVSEGDTITGEYKDRTLPAPYTSADQLRLTTTALMGTSKISTTNLRITDDLGHKLNTVSDGQTVFVVTDLKNNQQHDQPFAYLVQIQDANGVTVSLSWTSGTLSAGQTLSPALSWTAPTAGPYTVQVFVDNSVNNPTALSPPLTSTITVAKHTGNPIVSPPPPVSPVVSP